MTPIQQAILDLKVRHMEAAVKVWAEDNKIHLPIDCEYSLANYIRMAISEME